LACLKDFDEVIWLGNLTNMYTREYGVFHAKTLYFYLFIIAQRQFHLRGIGHTLDYSRRLSGPPLTAVVGVLYQIRKRAREGWSLNDMSASSPVV